MSHPKHFFTPEDMYNSTNHAMKHIWNKIMFHYSRDEETFPTVRLTITDILDYCGIEDALHCVVLLPQEAYNDVLRMLMRSLKRARMCTNQKCILDCIDLVDHFLKHEYTSTEQLKRCISDVEEFIFIYTQTSSYYMGVAISLIAKAILNPTKETLYEATKSRNHIDDALKIAFGKEAVDVERTERLYDINLVFPSS